MKDSWAEPDMRDEVVDYVRYRSQRTEIKMSKIVNGIGITHSKSVNIMIGMIGDIATAREARKAKRKAS